MDKEKAKQNLQQTDEKHDETFIKEGIASKSNRPLLWAIFSVLTVLIILLLIMIVLFVSGSRTQKDLFEKEQVKKEEIEKKESERQKEQIKKELEKREGITTSDSTQIIQDKVPVVSKPAATSIEKPKPKRCKAEKFDGNKYDDGELYTTLDGCETCECDDGDWDCTIKSSCIILPTDCSHNNHVYHDKDTRMAECDQICTCDKGSWKCELPAGSSCCRNNAGKVYHDGDSYEAEDGCNTCTCNNGSITCTMMLCAWPIFP